MPLHTSPEWLDHLGTSTKTQSETSAAATQIAMPCLTVLCHGDPARIGDWAWLPDLSEGRSVALSRVEPLFRPPLGGAKLPLAEPKISRSPIRVTPLPEGLVIATTRTPLEIDGRVAEGERLVPWGELSRGVVLSLADRVVLLLKLSPPSVPGDHESEFGLVGESRSMAQLRTKIRAVADLDVPVLIRGESGSGKELVAKAIQALSRRSDKVFLSLNMAAIPSNLAASELFGSARGAFSGADRSRPGFFRQSDGGTLFLDEIGETPPGLQALLLRALETGEIQPVGEERPVHVDVRVLAATDADLEAEVESHSFKEPLLYRLQSYEIAVPPLRERIEDLGRLLIHFLHLELNAIAEPEKLSSSGPYARPYLPAGLVARMARHQWPGNIRELRNAVRRLVIASRGEDQLRHGAWTETANRPETEPRKDPASTPTGTSKARKPSHRRYRDPSDVGEEELVATLREHRWNLKSAAEGLGISRGSLYVLIDGSQSLRKASNLGHREIQRAIRRVGTSFDDLSRELEVSKQGLKRRISELGIDPSTETSTEK